jgi:hypothetical protein
MEVRFLKGTDELSSVSRTFANLLERDFYGAIMKRNIFAIISAILLCAFSRASAQCTGSFEWTVTSHQFDASDSIPVSRIDGTWYTTDHRRGPCVAHRKYGREEISLAISSDAGAKTATIDSRYFENGWHTYPGFPFTVPLDPASPELVIQKDSIKYTFRRYDTTMIGREEVLKGKKWGITVFMFLGKFGESKPAAVAPAHLAKPAALASEMKTAVDRGLIWKGQ